MIGRAFPFLASAGFIVVILTGCGGISGPPPVTEKMAASVRGPHANVPTLNSGRRLFVSRCIECHVLPAIKEHAADAWPGLVSKMSARADLTPSERGALLSYILAAHDSSAAPP